jgi:hypothetical protein
MFQKLGCGLGGNPACRMDARATLTILRLGNDNTECLRFWACRKAPGIRLPLPTLPPCSITCSCATLARAGKGAAGAGGRSGGGRIPKDLDLKDGSAISSG